MCRGVGPCSLSGRGLDGDPVGESLSKNIHHPTHPTSAPGGSNPGAYPADRERT